MGNQGRRRFLNVVSCSQLSKRSFPARRSLRSAAVFDISGRYSDGSIAGIHLFSYMNVSTVPILMPDACASST